MTHRPESWLDAGLPLECPCQWGMTGHCHQGRHTACTAHTVTMPETYLPLPSGGYDPPVWLADRVCRWRCACECHAGPEQLDLFA